MSPSILSLIVIGVFTVIIAVCAVAMRERERRKSDAETRKVLEQLRDSAAELGVALRPDRSTSHDTPPDDEGR